MATPTTLEPKVGCISTAAQILGNKWTAQILRDLADRSQRFCSLEKSVEGINPRILSQRLNQLEESGVVSKSDNGYSLTDKGRELIPVLEQMAQWGAKYC